MTDDLENKVASHYGARKLLDGILTALKDSGLDPDHLALDALGAVDEFHIGGRQATRQLVSRMSLRPDQRVIDVGCGIGGAARYIAAQTGCSVTGIDLTPEYIEVARDLTRRTHLESKVRFEIASALSMPFQDGCFDAGITFHVAMNIKDRESLYREVGRVLKSGAMFCAYDVMTGPNPGIDYPVPWAETAETSFLKSPSETEAHLVQAGFDILEREDRTQFAIDFFRERMTAMAGGPPPVGLHLIMGANAQQKFQNMQTNLDAGKITPFVLIAKRR